MAHSLTLRQRWAARLQRSWVKRDWLAVAMLDVSWLYAGLMALRSWLYKKAFLKSTRLTVPVVVVGNVVAGGAGKTPVVIALVQHLQRQGWQVGVVSRGYGRKAAVDTLSALEVKAHTPVDQSGDEPALIHSATGAPVFVATARVAAAQALLAAYPQTQVIVCDDGLQHLALQRDIEVCVFDDRGVGNGWRLPAGPLREGWPRKVDFVLQTTAGLPASDNASSIVQRHLASYALRADGTQVPLANLASLADQSVHAVAGIAQPEAFFSMLRSMGLALAHTSALPDHFDFSTLPPALLTAPYLLCTQKDAAKLWPHCPNALAVPLVITIDPAFFAALDNMLRTKLSSPHGHQTT
jgi:tetraacyldisaccharide 4'-kinase